MRILVIAKLQLVGEMYCAALWKKFSKAHFKVVPNLAAAMGALKREKHDIVVLDLSMVGGPSEMDILEHLRQSPKCPPVLVVSSYPARNYGVWSIRAGACGFIEKTADLATLADAVKHVVSGEVWVSAELNAELLRHVARSHDSILHKCLTRREFDIFLRLAGGSTVTEIAKGLNLSPKTVGGHRAAILDKMSLPSTAALMRYAIKHSLVA